MYDETFITFKTQGWEICLVGAIAFTWGFNTGWTVVDLVGRFFI